MISWICKYVQNSTTVFFQEYYFLYLKVLNPCRFFMVLFRPPWGFWQKKVSRGEKGRANRLSYSFLKKPSSFKDSFLETCSMSRSASQLQEIPQHVKYMRNLKNVNFNTKYVDDQMLVILHFLLFYYMFVSPQKQMGMKALPERKMDRLMKATARIGTFLGFLLPKHTLHSDIKLYLVDMTQFWKDTVIYVV